MDEVYVDKEAIGAELMHYLNSLIEALTNESILESQSNQIRSLNSIESGKRSIKHENEFISNEAWVIGVDATEDLKDIIKLIKREIEGGVESERYAISLLYEWDAVNKKLLPLWNLSSEDIEIQSLIVQILFWLTMPPNEDWRKFNSKTNKCRAYQRNMQRTKFSLCSNNFWRGIVALYKKLKAVIATKGYLREEEIEIRNKRKEIEVLKKEDKYMELSKKEDFLPIDVDLEYQKEVNNEKSGYKRLEKLEVIRKLRDQIITINERAEKRVKLYNNRIGMIKGLIIQTLKIQDSNTIDSVNNFGVKSLHLLLVSKLVNSGVLEIVDEDYMDFFNKEDSNFFEEFSIAPWRMLEYIYGLICNLQPIDFVNELFSAKKKQESEFLKKNIKNVLIKKNISSGFTTNSLMNRHSKFNPVLARKRIKEINAGISDQINNSKYSSLKRVNKYKYDYDPDEVFECIDIFVGAMQSAGGTFHDLNMYNFPTIEGALGGLDTVNTCKLNETVQLLGHFLETFFKEKLPKLFEKLFLILRNGNYKHTTWDTSKLINLITWVLAYKRSIFTHIIVNEKNSNIIEEELARLLLEIRYLIDTQEHKTIEFLHSTIKHHSREALLRNKSHKIVRVALRCLNEQLKIIHLVLNSNSEVIKEIGISTILFMVRLDIMNDLSWILKHFVKASHHPELILYAIEVSNRLIKLISKIGSSVVVNLQRRRRDRLSDTNEFNDDEMCYVNENDFSGFNQSCYIQKTKILTLEEMMIDFCDGRIAYNIMTLVANYSSNHSNINWHISRLAKKIITTQPFLQIKNGTGSDKLEQIYCGLFFQLSYFIIFATILNDKCFLKNSNVDKGAQDIISLSRYIIHRFWEVAKINSFVFIELLFSKNSPRGLGLADPERLTSVFTNYEQGIDAAILERVERTGNDLFEAQSYVKSKINKEKLISFKWTKEDDEELLNLYSEYKTSPKCISIIKNLLSNDKSENFIKKRLKELVEFDDEDEITDESKLSQEKYKNVKLISSILNFKKIKTRTSEDFENFDLNHFLREQHFILEEASFTRQIISNHLDDIPLEIPSSLPNCLLLDTRYIELLEAIGLKQPDKKESFWIVPKEVRQDEFIDTVAQFKVLIELEIPELIELIEKSSNQKFLKNGCKLEFNKKNLEEILQIFIEDPKLFCNNFKTLEKEVNIDHGLLNLISYELNLILTNNAQGKWQNTNIEDISIFISQERLDQLGIKKDFTKIFESDILNKLVSILGFKQSFISKELQLIINLKRGITQNNTSDILFDQDIDEEYTEKMNSWTLDLSNISFDDFKKRVLLFDQIAKNLTNIKANVTENYSRSYKFPKKPLLELSENLLSCRIEQINLEFIEKIIQKLDELTSAHLELGNNDENYVLKFYLEHYSTSEQVKKILELLMVVALDSSYFKWSLKPLFNKYNLNEIISLTSFLKKISNLDVFNLKGLVKNLEENNFQNGGNKLQSDFKKRKLQAVNFFNSDEKKINSKKSKLLNRLKQKKNFLNFIIDEEKSEHEVKDIMFNKTLDNNLNSQIDFYTLE